MFSKIKRCCFLYLKYLNLNFKSLLVYKLDFWIGIFGMLIQNICNLCIIVFIFNNLDTIGNYTFDQILFIYAYSAAAYSIWYLLFCNSISMSYFINRGILDRYMLRPTSVLFQIFTDHFEADSLGDVIFSCALLVIAIFRLKAFSFKLLFLPILIISSSLIYTSIALLCSITCFFTIGYNYLANITMSFNEFSRYPLSVYNKPLRFVLTVIIPIGFTAYYPSMYYINGYKNGIMYVILTPIIAISIFLIVCFLWNRSLKYYNSPGN